MTVSTTCPSTTPTAAASDPPVMCDSASEFAARLSSALASVSDQAARVAVLSRALQHPAFSVPLCGAAVRALLTESLQRSSSEAWLLLNNSLDRPVVRATLAADAQLVHQICRAASPPSCWSCCAETLARLPLNAFSDQYVLELLQFVCQLLDGPVSPPAWASSLVARLCDRLERCGSGAVSSAGASGLLHCYVDTVLPASARLCWRAPAVRAPLQRLMLCLWLEGAADRSSAPSRSLLRAVCLADEAAGGSGQLEAPQLAAVATLLRPLSTCMCAEPEPVGALLLGCVLRHQLSICASVCVLPVLAFWTDWLCLTPRDITLSTPLPTVAQLSLSADEGQVAGLGLSVRLRLLLVLLTELVEQRPLLAASWRQVSVLTWLRACRSHLLSLIDLHRATPDGPPVADACYRCLAQLLTLSPHTAPLVSKLPPLLTTALTDTPLSPAADHLVCHVFSMYATLQQLPRLVPQLLLACRAADCRRLLLHPSQCRQLAQLLANVPQQHVINLLRTVLFHLQCDVLQPLLDCSATSCAPADQGEVAGVSAGAGPVCMVLQLTSLLCDHLPVTDADRLAPPVLAQLPTLLAAVAKLVRRSARAVCSRQSDALSDTGPTGDAGQGYWLPQLAGAAVSWRRCHSAMLHYSHEYARLCAPAGSDNNDSQGATQPPSLLTEPMAPLTPRLLLKLSARLGGGDGQCSDSLWNLLAEFESDSSALPSLLPLQSHLSRQSVRERVDWQTLVDWLRGAGPQRLREGVTANRDSWQLQLALAAVLLLQLSPSGKRRRDQQSASDGLLCSELQCLAAQMALAQDVREPLLQFLSRLGEHTVSWNWPPSEASASGGGVRDERCDSLLAAVTLLPLEHMCSQRLALWLATLLLCSHSLSTCSSAALTNTVWQLVARVLGALHEPWPLVALQLARLAPLLWRHCAHNRRSLLATLVDSLRGRHALHLLSLCDAVRYVLTQTPDTTSSSSSSATQTSHSGAMLVALAVPLLRHLLDTWRTMKRDNSARAQLRRPLKRLARQVSRCVVLWSPDGSSSCSARVSLHTVLQLTALLLQAPARWRKLLHQHEQQTLPPLCQLALQLIHSSGTADRAKEQQQQEGCEQQLVSAAWQLLTHVCQPDSGCLAETSWRGEVAALVWRHIASTSSAPVDQQCHPGGAAVWRSQLHTLLAAMTPTQLAATLRRLLRHTRRLSVAGGGGEGGCRLEVWRRHMEAWTAVATCQQLSASCRNWLQRPAVNALLLWLAHGLARAEPSLAGTSGGDGWTLEEAERVAIGLRTVVELLQQRCVALEEAVCAAALLACHPPQLSSLCVPLACRILVSVGDIGFLAASTHAHVFDSRSPLLAQLLTYMVRHICLLCDQRQRDTGDGQGDEDECLLSVANRLCRVARQVVSLGAAFSPLLPSLIGQVLQASGSCRLPQLVRQAVDRCLVELVAGCRAETITRLKTVLPSSQLPQFHALVDTHRRFHKFTGRV